MLGLKEEAKVLKQALREEKNVDKKLTKIAGNQMNVAAKTEEK